MRLVLIYLLFPLLLAAHAAPQVKVDQAIRMAREQELEKAFKLFLEALDETPSEPVADFTATEKELYDRVQQLYLSQPSRKAKEVATKLRQDYGHTTALHPDYYRLQYLIALAYANSEQFDEFFVRFYPSYRHVPEHYLVDKTRALLNLKLMLWAKTPEEKNQFRQQVYQYTQQGLRKNNEDYTLYKMAIAFAPKEEKDRALATLLNNMLSAPMILPREEFLFFIKEAAEMGQFDLANRLLDQAKAQYGESRSVQSVEDWVAGQKELKNG